MSLVLQQVPLEIGTDSLEGGYIIRNQALQ